MFEELPWHENDPRFLQKLIDAIPVPLFYKDLHGVYLGCNKHFEAFIRLSRKELVGRSVYDIAPPELAEIYHAKDQDLLDNPGKQIYETEVESATGGKHQVIFHKATFTDPAGATAGLVGVILDITEFRDIERQLRHQAEHDALTGLHNRHGSIARLREEFERAQRYRHPLSILMIDLDDFKTVNDRFGHPAGDRILQHLARHLVALLRGSDLAVRYGGEEFLILLPETDGSDASRLAERLRLFVQTHPPQLEPWGVIDVSVSIGVSSFPAEADTIERLVTLADERLYVAKRRGRNRVIAGAESAAAPVSGERP